MVHCFSAPNAYDAANVGSGRTGVWPLTVGEVKRWKVPSASTTRSSRV